jgi:hypothetical protein
MAVGGGPCHQRPRLVDRRDRQPARQRGARDERLRSDSGAVLRARALSAGPRRRPRSRAAGRRSGPFFRADTARMPLPRRVRGARRAGRREPQREAGNRWRRPGLEAGSTETAWQMGGAAAPIGEGRPPLGRAHPVWEESPLQGRLSPFRGGAVPFWGGAAPFGAWPSPLGRPVPIGDRRRPEGAGYPRKGMPAPCRDRSGRDLLRQCRVGPLGTAPVERRGRAAWQRCGVSWSPVKGDRTMPRAPPGERTQGL